MEQFGRYQLLSRIGKGGMAEVFRARLEAPAGGEKILVVKRILPSLSADPEFIRLFVNEAKIALPLTHGNITSVFEFGEVDGQYYLAMEFIHGHDLEAVLRRAREAGRPLPVTAALFIGAEIAKGLAYAHGLTTPDGRQIAVVHQDVSPQNVLVSYDGAVKLTDFGIARMKASAAATTGETQAVVRGKAHYLAPEAHAGGSVDGRVDSFALACVVSEMLSGRSPIEGHDERELLEAKKSGRFTLPSVHRDEIQDLDEVLSRALDPNPEKRTTTRELQVQLTQALFRRAPDFGPHELATWLRDLFSFELYREKVEGSGQEGVRDRLIYQLAKAGIEPGAKELPTSELLSMRTLELAGDAAEDELPTTRRRVTVAILVAILVGALGAGSYFALRPPAPVISDAPPTREGYGYLSLNSWPSALVMVDGVRLGRTPVLRYEVKQGRHKVVFEKPEFGLVKEVEVEVPLGGEKTVVVKLDQ